MPRYLSVGDKSDDCRKCCCDGQACSSERDDPERPHGDIFSKEVLMSSYVRPVRVENEPRDQHDAMEKHYAGGRVRIGSPYRGRKRDEHDERQKDDVYKVQHPVSVDYVLELPRTAVE